MSDQSERVVISVSATSHKYEVLVGAGVFSDLNILDDSVVVADSRFREFLDKRVSGNCIFVDALEANKILGTVESIIIELQKLGVRSHSTVIAVGGGIVQDLMTMVASIYMRGISWVYVPTTLLGMVDSCIGGKSSINTRTVKNLIGNIYPPIQIFVDTNFLSTLSETDFLCGLAEAAKITFCSGPDAFGTFLEIVSKDTTTEYVEMLFFVLSRKKWFIETDEFDRAERKLLNFGHTFGHALESATNHGIPHGIAVALGIRAALAFVASEREIGGIESQLDKYMRDLAMCGLDYGALLRTIDWGKFSSAFDGDKKHSSGAYKLITPLQNGGVEIVSFQKNDELIEKIRVAQLGVLEEMAK